MVHHESSPRVGWIDVGCFDFEAAARNREMVANKWNITEYLRVEAALKITPCWEPLPAGIPRGTLPVVGRYEARALYGYGLHEVNDNLDEGEEWLRK